MRFNPVADFGKPPPSSATISRAFWCATAGHPIDALTRRFTKPVSRMSASVPDPDSRPSRAPFRAARPADSATRPGRPRPLLRGACLCARGRRRPRASAESAQRSSLIGPVLLASRDALPPTSPWNSRPCLRFSSNPMRSTPRTGVPSTRSARSSSRAKSAVATEPHVAPTRTACWRACFGPFSSASSMPPRSFRSCFALPNRSPCSRRRRPDQHDPLSSDPWIYNLAVRMLYRR